MSESKTPSDYTQFAHAELDKFYEEWPGGLDEVEASVRGWRERAQQFESDLATALAERDSYKTAWEQSDKSCRDLSEKVLPNVRAERDALAARVEKAEKDAGRWRFVRSKVSRILNETTLKMDGLRVEVYYDKPQAFVILPTDNGALFDEAIDAALSREEKS